MVLVLGSFAGGGEDRRESTLREERHLLHIESPYQLSHLVGFRYQENATTSVRLEIKVLVESPCAEVHQPLQTWTLRCPAILSHTNRPYLRGES
jgi:hypothetical protein